MSNLPKGVNEALWFESASCDGNDYLVESNPHTFPGRMTAYCPHDVNHSYYNVSLSDLASCSDECRNWAHGFVVGSEPGSPLNDEGFELEEDSPALVSWQNARQTYAATGSWPDDAARRP